jgi:hypothetical protein
MRRRTRRGCWPAIGVVLAALAVPGTAAAATIHVTVREDVVDPGDGNCSLREAVTAADDDAPSGTTGEECAAGSTTGADTINVPPGTYLLDIAVGTTEDGNARGDLDIGSDVIFQGAGAADTVITGGVTERVLQVLGAPTVTLRGLTITRGNPGQLPDGTGLSGGGILSGPGTLVLEDCIVRGNVAGQGRGGSQAPEQDGGDGGRGGDGGGIYTTGALMLTRTTVRNNTAGAGGAGGAGVTGLNEPKSGGAGGDGGSGGGVYAGGALTVSDSTIADNRAGDGGAGGQGFNADSGDGGAGGSGGGLAGGPGAVTIADSVLSGNGAGAGGVGADKSIFATGPVRPGAGGAGGDGGAARLAGAELTVTRATITGNRAGPGGNAGNAGDNSSSGFGSFGGEGGDGGGIAAEIGSASIMASTISGNQAGPGGGAEVGNAGSGRSGDGGNGGGMHHASGALSIERSTVNGNVAGNAQPLETATTGVGGSGGGVAHDGGTVELTNVTFSGNEAGDGAVSGGNGGGLWSFGQATVRGATFAGNTAGVAGGTPFALPGRGGAISASATTLTGTIASGNAPENCAAAPIAGAHNISFPELSCGGTNADPLLGPLAANGGPTQTRALGPGSPAIDQMAAAACLATDQRGTARPQGAGCDIGAYERVPDSAPPPGGGGGGGGGTGGGGNAGGGGAGTQPDRDTLAPTLTLLLRRQPLLRALRRGYRVDFTTDEPATAVLEVFSKRRGSRVARGAKAIAGAGKSRLRARFNPGARRRLGRRRGVTVRVRLTVTDAAGNASTRSKRVRLRR